MNGKLWVDYLVIGGKRHGERYVELQEENEVFIKAQIQPLIEFIAPSIAEKLSKKAGKYYKVERFVYNGKTYLLAILKSKAGYDIENLLLQSDPPVKPID
ncbi:MULTISPECIES: hypothetical protein [Sodalis]|jgi:hypothetical protein|uniref:Uncharacterized protein n=1 Tax=Sodalis ligni TaxID=2697027 RepID=A0A4R1N725_9GAMM|nr:hypothetical protein [Sodalis ligni]TCL02347.1 hypothetical protein EZJ58_0360 [Sodalis ligni]